MSLWRRITSALGARRTDLSLKLAVTRLRRLNRRYREFLGLFVDAAEKQGEGFILDRQYIVSLVERAFHLGYEILFHANVLRPGTAVGSYAALDRFKGVTRDLLAGKGRPLDGRLTGQIAETNRSPGEAGGDGAVGSAPVREIAPSQLREARAKRVTLVENEGYVACAGVTSGRVWLVQTEADLQAFPGHGVLVARRLEPTAALLRALPRVAAILVEQGTPRDRIAALARSFRIPTLLGVAEVTTRLPPGAPVTVDATDAVVYSGVFEELIHHHHLHGDSRDEEPEYRLLNAVLREMGSPVPAAAFPETSPEERQTLCETIEGAYVTTLCQLAAGLRPPRESLPVASPGFSEDIRVADVSVLPSGAEPEAPGMLRGPDPTDWVLAGLVAMPAPSRGRQADEDGGMGPVRRVPTLSAWVPDSFGAARDARGLLYRAEESVTALLSTGDRVVLLDGVVTGESGGNHIVVCAGEASAGSREKAEGLDRMHAEAVRLGLAAVRASRTTTAWIEGIPPGSIRETLTRVGQLARRATLNRWAAQ